MKKYIIISILILLTISFVHGESNPDNKNNSPSAVRVEQESVQLKIVKEDKQVKPATIAKNNKILLNDLKNSSVPQTAFDRLMGVVGCLLLILIALAFSTNRSKIKWNIVFIGFSLQFFFAFIILKTNFGKMFFASANDFITKLLSFTQEGSRFVFGNLVDINAPAGIPLGEPFTMSALAKGQTWVHIGAIMGFGVLPTIIFFSALTAVLYHLRILEWVVRCAAYVMQKTMKTSGAESFSAAANIFLGQTEAPLLIKPFIANMTSSEIMAIMTGGFATVAGGVLAAYVGMLSGYFPDIAGHIIAASVMSAPASLMIAKIMVPEIGTPESAQSSKIHIERKDANLLDAASRGTSEGLMLALNVGAMLISFIALVALVNWMVGGVGTLFNMPYLSLEKIFSWIFAPLAFIIGVPWQDAGAVGELIGLKTVVNEFVAYMDLAKGLQNGSLHNAKSVIIAIYALCGFANFSSIGIQIGGLTTIAPSRRADFAKLGLKAMIAGTIVCLQTAAIAGILI